MKRLYFFKLCLFVLISACFVILTSLNRGFSQKKDFEQTNKKNQNNLKMKVDFNESPNKEDFFTKNDETGQYQVILLNDLKGMWRGVYRLTPELIFWTNPNLNKHFFFTSTYFGPYSIWFNFIPSSSDKNSDFEIIQDDAKYENVKFHLANNKQINYWADALTKDWTQVVRGKIFKINDNELLCIFQTSVHENKVLIYAFNGEVVLNMFNKESVGVGYNK